jgi:hypothetical protein
MYTNADGTTIYTFSWGELYIYPKGKAIVLRNSGHMKKDEVINALAEQGYRLTGRGTDMRVPHMNARVYPIAA